MIFFFLVGETKRLEEAGIYFPSITSDKALVIFSVAKYAFVKENTLGVFQNGCFSPPPGRNVKVFLGSSL